MDLEIILPEELITKSISVTDVIGEYLWKKDESWEEYTIRSADISRNHINPFPIINNSIFFTITGANKAGTNEMVAN